MMRMLIDISIVRGLARCSPGEALHEPGKVACMREDLLRLQADGEGAVAGSVAVADFTEEHRIRHIDPDGGVQADSAIGQEPEASAREIDQLPFQLQGRLVQYGYLNLMSEFDARLFSSFHRWLIVPGVDNISSDRLTPISGCPMLEFCNRLHPFAIEGIR